MAFFLRILGTILGMVVAVVLATFAGWVFVLTGLVIVLLVRLWVRKDPPNRRPVTVSRLFTALSAAFLVGSLWAVLLFIYSNAGFEEKAAELSAARARVTADTTGINDMPWQIAAAELAQLRVTFSSNAYDEKACAKLVKARQRAQEQATAYKVRPTGEIWLKYAKNLEWVAQKCYLPT